MHIPQAMRQPHHATPPLPLLVLLLMYCATACIAAAPATQYWRGLDEMMRSGLLSTAVVREVPRKGQGTMRAYTVATQDDNSGWEPIRIKVFTDGLKSTRRKKTYCEKVGDECDSFLGEWITCKEEHLLSEAKKKLYTEKILPGAVKLHAERLLVKPTERNITVPSNLNEACKHFKVPTEHMRYGVAADFVIYASAGPSGTNSRAVWAATCNTWEDFRPSIGAINFDPRYMTDTAWSVRVAAHEIAHALGFSKESMEEKSLVKNSANIVREKVRKMVAGDHVQEKAKAHFGCDSLEGMELEDEGGTREKAIPHWKERHARDELMAPIVGAGYYTALTMAVFADMEYYRVNWSMAEPMGWGNGTGCDFLEKKCNATENLAGKYPHMFCNDSDKETLRCTSDRRHVGTCTAIIVENEGSPTDKDFCPVVSSYFHEKSSGIKYNTCSDGTVTSPPGSLTGGDSWCLDAELLETKDGKHKSVKGVCAQVLCAEGTVKVKYLGNTDNWHECPEGSVIPVTLENFEKDGKIKCPKYVEVCTIAANGSSLVIPSVLEDDKGEEQEEQVEESVVAPVVSPAAEPHAEASSPGQPHTEMPSPRVQAAPQQPREEIKAQASTAEEPYEEEPRAAASSTEEPRAEASIAGKTSEAPVVQAALQQPQQESKAGQNATVGDSANTEQVPANTSQGSVGKAAFSNSHAAGEATGDGGTVRESGLLPSLPLLLGLWGFAAL
ncbi:putative surface protease GP63 [Trypanosoma cruzi]|uniref:Leishmanolysin-like peptidase n=2 Tax=Trypanosoma cruzi TaxID=5693 RepID=Q4E1H6_TRYCC|nr:surface protease GP63, putative [Trypanosoma cruzi]EAN98641.1 surface protease GP63, putative [Trypanosoma cruzi]PWV17039.1 putative surface protease GP63 [Trypanosoma cruzi]|eukprot:XP_820492.1 surface protease GP63 [Trypanosoma cruzi strain CL Brener]